MLVAASDDSHARILPAVQLLPGDEGKSLERLSGEIAGFYIELIRPAVRDYPDLDPACDEPDHVQVRSIVRDVELPLDVAMARLNVRETAENLKRQLDAVRQLVASAGTPTDTMAMQKGFRTVSALASKLEMVGTAIGHG
jgi:hypothetical protein